MNKRCKESWGIGYFLVNKDGFKWGLFIPVCIFPGGSEYYGPLDHI